MTTKKFPPKNGDNAETSFFVSRDDERRNTGYMIASLAMKYMAYHEIGHLACGRLEMALLLITALVIVKESLNEELFSLQEIEESRYPPTIVRLVISLYMIMGRISNCLWSIERF